MLKISKYSLIHSGYRYCNFFPKYMREKFCTWGPILTHANSKHNIQNMQNIRRNFTHENQFYLFSSSRLLACLYNKFYLLWFKPFWLDVRLFRVIFELSKYCYWSENWPPVTINLLEFNFSIVFGCPLKINRNNKWNHRRLLRKSISFDNLRS